MKLSPTWLREFVELKVDNRHLAEDLTNAGIAVEGISGEGDHMVFDAEITTNRPDEMNHYGLAREASAIYDLPLKPIQPRLPKEEAATGVPIEVHEPDLCPRFTARVIRNATIKPSPAKVANRLALLDQRPISNAVDATNYVLWEIGKPTHVYDLDLLEGGRIIVRKARSGETLKTLDGVERKLSPDDLVVADAHKPVGFAGVMGGFDTMITDQTRNILIESAWWDPLTVRRTSRRHGLHTDASHRFERGADFESTVLSCDRVAELILQSGGGQLEGGIVDVVSRHLDQAPVALHLPEVRRILGGQVGAEEIVRILTRLGFYVSPERRDSEEFTVHIPSWRLDVEREIDLIEEIARIYGYNRFPNTLPAYVGSVMEPPEAQKDNRLRSTLLALGYNETVSVNFISHEDAGKFSSTSVVELANPLSEEASVMRNSMVPGMLNMLAYNLNRGTDDVRLFESGNVFEAVGADRQERKTICMGATAESLKKYLPQGAVLDVSRNEAATASEIFRSLKGDVEQLLSGFAFDSIVYEAKAADYYHPGRSARALMDGEVVAQFGQIHPDLAASRKLRQEIYLAEVYLDLLYQHELRRVHYQALPRYPAVERDFSFIFADAVIFEKIEQGVRALNLPALRDFVPVEIFRGGGIPAGRYSILLRATFQSDERTLRDDEVVQWSAQIVKALEAVGGTLRAN